MRQTDEFLVKVTPRRGVAGAEPTSSKPSIA